MEKSKKRSLYYCLFDWANSPFSVVVITFIFSSYFTNKIADDKISGMSLWGWAIAVSGIVIALICPVRVSITPCLCRGIAFGQRDFLDPGTGPG